MGSILAMFGGFVLILIIGTAVWQNIIALQQETITVQWEDVEDQLQRRNDLIPNVVNTVKDYAAHEKTVLEDVAHACSQWAKAISVEEKVKAAGDIDRTLGRLLLIVTEKYPNLKADRTFLKLMDELSETENRIAVERMQYNKAVRDFNVTISWVYIGGPVMGNVMRKRMRMRNEIPTPLPVYNWTKMK